MRFGLAGYAAALAACVVTSGLVGTADATPSASGASAPKAADTSQAAAGGMYGELGGNPARTVPQLRVGPARQASSSNDGGATNPYSEGGTVCNVYANSTGMGSYCSSGGGTVKTLAERFPGLNFENCRYENPPPGVEVPRNPSPDEKKWQLRTCLTAIDWLTPDGGPQRRIIMDLVLVDQDMDTTYHDTPLSDYLWNNVQTQYPVPMLKVEPKTYPVVGQEAYFTFSWLGAKSRQPISQGPYEDAERGGPYIERRNGGLLMRAQAGEIRIDPQIKGHEPFTCTVDKLGYQHNKSPRREDQKSDCVHIFDRSSAVAPKYSTAKRYLEEDKDVYRMQLDIRWDVEYGRPGDMQPLGDGFHMRLFQDLPVMDAEAVNEPPPISDLG